MSEPTPKTRAWWLIVAVGVSALTVVVILLLTMDHSTWKALRGINPWYFLAILVVLAGRWLSTIARSHLLVIASGRRIPFWNTTKSVLGGDFAGSISPLHSAGVPVQIYFFSRYGLTVGEATAVVSTAAAVSILFFVLALPLVLVVSASRVHVGLGLRTFLVAAAIAAFFFLMLFVYYMRDPAGLESAANRRAPRFLRRRPGFQRGVTRFSNEVKGFSESLRRILKAPRWILLFVLVLTMTFWCSGMVVSPLILCGLGYTGLFWKALLAQFVVSCVLPFIPVPGESGFAEAAYAGVFSVFVKKSLIGLVALAWRFFMFYLMVLIQSIFFVIALRGAARRETELEGVKDDCDNMADGRDDPVPG